MGSEKSIEKIKNFYRKVCIDRFRKHCGNEKIEIVPKEEASLSSNDTNSWRCAILWGNEDIRGVFIVNFTTLSILGLGGHVFELTSDDALFEHAKDFVKEFCNLLAGHIKGIYNNEKLDVSMSLPILSKSISVESFMSDRSEKIYEDSWIMGIGSSNIEVTSHFQVISDIDVNSFKFVDDVEKMKIVKNNVEIF